ncbi:hypothetical protein B0T16DRAFT_453596 [Cercophora newfieldiana]|uniref:Uncharacterized protein n=1 Tax=Cercophora newfieldiana TaxID=92897 RepID=A0AA39YEC1_9PEZI|nr:hypothetical protein B0T16DRAFT_453596 [Cercophora newfieldiana]
MPLRTQLKVEKAAAESKKTTDTSWAAALLASRDNRRQPWQNAFPAGGVNVMVFTGKDIATYDNKMLQENGGGQDDRSRRDSKVVVVGDGKDCTKTLNEHNTVSDPCHKTPVSSVYYNPSRRSKPAEEEAK